MKVSQQVIDKYNKVWMLAQRGEPNEAKNAQRVLDNMQRHHPNIDQIAKKMREKEARQEKELNEPEDPQEDTRHWSDVYNEMEQKRAERQERKEKWKEWKQKASSFFNWAAESAHQAFSMQQLQEWAYDVEIRMRENQSGSISAAVKIPKNIVWRVDRLTPHHRLVFARMVGQMVEQEVYEYLGEE